MKEITYRSPKFYEEAGDNAEKRIHLILIATKPDIIKQVPLYRELQKRGHFVLLGHTGQHFSENLSGGMLKEFGVEPDFNLNIRGEYHELVAQIIARLGFVIGELKKRGKIVIPYIHGDTTTAMAGGIAAYTHAFASVHVEAGIRTLTPDYKKGNMSDVAAWKEFLMDRKNWERGSQEPYPEQFNTRTSETVTGIHLAPVELDRGFMLSEGFSEDRIRVVGNSVADATMEAVKNAKKATVFERHPRLAKGDFVRFCIHRRENCVSDRRFLAIYGAMKALIEEGRGVLLIDMIQTKKAFERLGLTEEVRQLAKQHKNFVYSEVWPEYRDVIAAMQKAAVCATDSGSMQEEMNILGVPCVTLRFGSDRSESAMAGGNLIAPPVDAETIKKILEYAWENEDMKKAPKLYGKDVSKKSIDFVEEVLGRGEELFRDDVARLHL
ncbi:MAG: UDP-N-acetylglucosamine 2-epimerase [Candidatus Peribacteraceae bacterium]